MGKQKSGVRILSAILAISMLLTMAGTPVFATDDNGVIPETPGGAAVCTCTALCAEDTADASCPVCAADWTVCAFTKEESAPPEAPDSETPEQPADPAPPVCDCIARCTETTVNASCPVCGSDWTACAFTKEESAPPETPDQEAPEQPAAPEPSVCDCIARCTEATVNEVCPVCVADWEKCAYVSAPDNGFAAISATANEIAAWYDGLVAADPACVDKNGVFLDETLRNEFLTRWSAVIDAADALEKASPDADVYGTLSQDETIRRLLNLAAAMGGYVIDLMGFSSGSGTAGDPYLVSTVADLQAITAAYVTTPYYYKLTADLDLSSVANWTPIGSSSAPFQGVFDGDGHTISNMKISGTTTSNALGLFGSLSGATIRNLTVKSAVIDATYTGDSVYAAPVVGYAGRSTIDGSTANQCTVSVTNNSGFAYAGGVVGYSSSSPIKNCVANGFSPSFSRTTAKAPASSAYAGGLIGYSSNDNVVNGYVWGATITASASTADSSRLACAGGLIANAYQSNVYNCGVSGWTGKVEAGYQGELGGLFGRTNGTSAVAQNCFARGGTATNNASTSNKYTGGITGNTLGGYVFTDCYYGQNGADGTPIGKDSSGSTGHTIIFDYGGDDTMPGLNAGISKSQTLRDEGAKYWTSLQAPPTLSAPVNMPVVNTGTKSIYAKGCALVISGSSDTSTTVYYDANGNGKYDSGEMSLAGMGVPNAPADGTDLSAWTIYGGSPNTSSGQTSLSMQGGGVYNLFGGGYSSSGGADAPASNTSITITGGKVLKDVYGGGYAAYALNSKVSGTTSVTISNATVNGNVYGAGKTEGNGNSSADVSGAASVKIQSGGVVQGRVYGGGLVTTGTTTSTAAVSSATITIDTGASVLEVYGGGNNAGSVGATDITIKGTVATSVWGGGMGARDIVQRLASVRMSSGIVNGNIFGGGSTSGGTVGSTSVNVSGGTVKDSVYGGGNNGAVTGDTNVTVSGSAVVSSGVFGGGYAGAVTNTSVTLSGGTVGSVRGAGGAASATVKGNTNVTISGGSVTTVYGGGNSPVTGNTTLTVRGGTVSLNAFGGCGSGYTVGGTSTVNLSGGTVTGSVFAGGLDASAVVTGAKRVYLSGNPMVGNKTNTGIDLASTTDKLVNVNAQLSGGNGAITLINPASTAANTVVASATSASFADASKFTLSGQTLMSSGNSIVVASRPKVVGTAIYANGLPLLITGTSDTSTTVSVDINGNGVLDAGDKSLAAYGVDGTAPADGSNLSTYQIYGGGDTALTGNTSITALSGKVGTIYGGGKGANVTGTTAVTVKGTAKTSTILGGGSGGTTGSTSVTISGNAVVNGHVTGGGDSGSIDGSATVNGNTVINIGENATITNNVAGGGSITNVPSINHTVTGTTTITLSGGTVNGRVAGGTVLNNGSTLLLDTASKNVGGVKAIRAVGKPVVKSGIDLSTFNMNGPCATVYLSTDTTSGLTPGASLYLINPQVTTAGTSVAITKSTPTADERAGILVAGYTTGVNGHSITIASALTPPTVDAAAKYIYGNGSALIIVGTDDTHTSVYWDKNRNGIYDSGIDTLLDGMTANMDLSAWGIYGGTQGTKASADTAVSLTGDTLVTMNGGKVYLIYGGCANYTGMKGNTYVTVHGGTVDYLSGGSNNGTVTGNVNITVDGGVVTNYISTSGWSTRVTGISTINLSGNIQVGQSTVVNAGIALPTLYAPAIPNAALNRLNIGALDAASRIKLRKVYNTSDFSYTMPDGAVVGYAVNGATLSSSNFTLHDGGSLDVNADGNLVINAAVAPKLYSAGYPGDDALILETTTRSFYKKLPVSPYGSAYGGYYRTAATGGNWAPILFSNKEEAVQWIGVNTDGTTVNNPQSNAGALKTVFGGQTYYFSTSENTIVDSIATTGPEDAAFLGVCATPAAAAQYIINSLTKYNITYNANGGTGDTLPSGHKKLTGLPFAIPTLTLAKGGQSITGWNTAADGSGTAFDLGGAITAESDVTLYAQYATDKVTVTLNQNGGISGTEQVLATRGRMMPAITALPIKQANGQTTATFAGYFDANGVQYYNESGAPVRSYPTTGGPTELKARWAEGTGIFAGRYSQYQVFDCHRTPAYPQANQPFRVFQFANPFTDSGKVMNGKTATIGQMSNAQINSKIFYFKPSGNSSNPFTLYFADDAEGKNEVQVSKAGKIYALGTEGFLFTSTAGNDYGYFISLSQAFKPGDEITYKPTSPGPITEDEAKESPANPNPWEPSTSYTVTFNSNGATVVATPSKLSVRQPESGSVTLGNEPSSPSRTGYTFDGWYTSATGGTKFDPYATPITASITVYARWVASKNTSTSISLYKDDTAWTGQTVAVRPVDAGGNLTGTATAAPYASKTKTYVTATGAISVGGIYAVLVNGADTGARFTHAVNQADNVEVNLYSIAYKPNGGTGSVPTGTTLLAGTDYKVLFTPAPAKAGYVFVGWTDRPAGQQAAKDDGYKIYEETGAWQRLTLSGATNLIAVFKQPTPTIGGGTDDFTLTQPDTLDGKGSLTLNDGKGDPADFEYSVDGGITWQPWPEDKTLETEQGGTVQIRRPAKGSDLMSDPATADILKIKPIGSLVTAADYTGVYDGKPHSITITKTGDAADAVVKYYSDAAWTQDETLSAPTVTNVPDSGKVVYFTVSKPGFETLKGSASINITKAALTATFAGESITFGDTPALAVAVTGWVEGESADNTGTGSYTAPRIASAPTTLGTHPLTPDGGAADNYSFTYVGGNLIIAKDTMELDVSAAGYEGLYDGQPHGITLTLTDKATGATVEDAQVAYRATLRTAYQNSTTRFTDAGVYTVYYKVTKEGYEDVTGSAQVIIKKVALTPNVTLTGARDYDGTTAASGGTLTGGVTLTGMVNGESVTAAGDIAFTTAGVGTNKHVDVTGIAFENPNGTAKNYTLSTTSLSDQSTLAEITAKEVSLSWTGAETRTYDGQPSAITAMADGLVAGDICGVTVTGGTEKNAGTHTAEATALSNPNYTLPPVTTQDYTISPAALTATYEGATLIYKDTFPVEAKAITVSGFVGGETPATLGSDYTAPTTLKGTGQHDATEHDLLAPSFSAAALQVDEYTFTPGGGSAKNYQFSYQPGSLRILNRDFDTVLLQGYTGEYDGQSHGPTIVNQDGFSGSLALRYYKDIGHTQPITNPSFKNVTNGPQTLYYTVSATGFNEESGSIIINITPKPVTPVITGTGSKIYDGTTDVPTGITLGLNGVLTGENAGLSGTPHMADANVGGGKTVTATSLTITNTNYRLTAQSASLAGAATVTAKPVTLIWSGDTGLTYTGTAKNVSAAVTASDLVSGDTCPVTVSGGRAVNAGDYIAAAALGNTNYTAASLTKGYTVSKAKLIAKMRDETIRYGGKPALVIEVTGFINGEDAASASGYAAPTIKTNPIPTEVTGSPYAIALQGGSADNYFFALDDTGKLTISKAAIPGVAAEGYTGTYDGKPHSVTVLAPAGTAIAYYTDEAMTQPLTMNSFTNVADSRTVWYKVSRTNYDDTTGSVVVAISPKSVTPAVTVTGSKVYDGSTGLGTATGSLTLSGVVDGDQVTASGDITFATADAGQNKAVNVANIALSGDSGNYALSADTLSGVTTTADITQLTAALQWHNDQGLVYDGTAKNVTATVGNLVGTDTCTVTVTGGDAALPGSHTAAATTLSNTNYKLPDPATHDYSIANATFTVSATPYEDIFDGYRHDGVTVTGTQPGDKVYYSTDGGETWTESVPQVGAKGDTPIRVKVTRPNSDDFIVTVTARVKSAPSVVINAPIFGADNVQQVTVSGAVSKGDYEIASWTFELRKADTTVWTTLDSGASPATPSKLLTTLERDTKYVLRLTATDTEGNTDSMTRSFQTQPATPPVGKIEGSLDGSASGSVTVTIELGNTVIGTLEGLDPSDMTRNTFEFSNLPDGEYNLVATDTDTGYKVTVMVSVKGAQTTPNPLTVTMVGEKQSTVKVENNAPPVAASGLNALFGTPAFTSDPEASDAAKSGGTVEIRLTADDAAPAQMEEIKKQTTQTIGVQVDLTVDMFITPKDGLTSRKNLPEVDELITVAIPLPSAAIGKHDYHAYRYHGGAVEALRLITNEAEKAEGTFRVDGGYAYIYSQKFSAYAITYSENTGGGSGSSQVTLTYQTNGGSAIASESHTAGTVVQLTKTPQRAGYTFRGWYADEDLTKPVTELKMTGSLTVYAKWERTEVPGVLDGVNHNAYVQGRPDGLVHPADNISRSEVAAIFYRLLQEDVRSANRSTASGMPDSTPGQWYNESVSTLVKLGILTGRPDGTFGPNQSITRAEFATIAARFSTESYSGPDLFTDTASHWARQEINRAAASGWLLGNAGGAFRPNDSITRAEAMTIINRVLQRIPESADALLPDMKTWPDNPASAWYYLAVQEATNGHDYEWKENGERWTKLWARPVSEK